MKKYIFLLLILCSTSSLFSQLIFKEPDWVGKAKEFVQKYYANDFDYCYSQFDTTVQKAMSKEQLKQAFDATIERFGKFQEFGKTDLKTQGEFIITSSVIKHEKMKYAIQITFGKNQKIQGFFFQPVNEPVKPSPVATYVDTTKYIEKDVKFGNEPFILDGKLTIPKSKTPMPVLILVHGSGPNDMDESIGPNKPFRDLALGLASQGVAVLRYNKRTFQHNMAMGQIKDVITLEQETIEDVGFAIDYLKSQAEINPNKIFVLGHSLGGLAIPQIAKEFPSAHGFIIMAGANQPLEDKILEQYEYISKLENNQGITSDVLNELKRQVERVKKEDFTDAKSPEKLPLGLPEAYWKYLNRYKPLELIKTIDKPYLVIHGQRDYQVNLLEFENWKTALKDNSKSHFQLYPKLNHLFLEGDKPSAPEEYGNPSNIPLYVIKDISQWINEN
jgi:hypothetical protein